MSVRNILAIAAILVCVLSTHAMPAASQGNPEVNALSLALASDTHSDGKTTTYDRQLLAEASQDTAPAPPAANALPSQAEGANQTAEASHSWLEYGLLVLLLAMVLLLAANLMVGHRPPKQH
ncbi:MAG: hypothetical protein M3437_20440 [Chloroflexota bacterium]|nr:hypothetical protein [Chloroflexota bacterium]MDQ5865038.1 hypothetical protein [Chloroflexota bacterium]